MTSRAITRISIIEAYSDAMPAELRTALASHLPRGAVRKFSESGLQTSFVMQGLDVLQDEPVVSASTFAESRSLEAFIDGFPTPSPARFQRSVHPSSVQQSRVVGDSPLRCYIPIAGRDGIAIAAARTALQMDEPIVHLIGGEECGTWSVGIHAGSGTGFAFGLRLESLDCESPATGVISWYPESISGASADASLLHLHHALSRREDYVVTHPDMGTLSIQWK